MSLVSPSKWLADLVKKSFLKEYEIRFSPKTIDSAVFMPTPSNIREKLGIGGRTMIVGVASDWDRRKGDDDFLALRRILGQEYVIVMVGLQKSQLRKLPNGIIGIMRTNSVRELTELYTAAERRRIVGAMQCVDEVLFVSTEETMDKRLLLKRCSFDVLFSGDDWFGTPRYRNTEKQFRECGIDIVYFPRFSGFDVPEDEVRARQAETDF